MNVLAELRRRFDLSLAFLVPAADQRKSLLDMIRPAQDAKFGDYQANFAMPLGKQLGQPPRSIAERVVAETDLADLCEPAEIAGPGFINLRLRTDWLTARLEAALADDRLGVPVAEQPRTVVIDYSSPNVAKAMHVGHIRSTVIGDALYRTLQFLGHRTISDNHLGDWGTQFGMIIYGYKHFVDRDAFARSPVQELNRLYKLVHRLVDYRENLAALPKKLAELKALETEIAQQRSRPASGDKAEEKKQRQALGRLEERLRSLREEIEGSVDSEGQREPGLRDRIAAVESSPELSQLAAEHPNIDEAVLAETAKLHAGDAENLRLWAEFLPACRQDIQKVYDRLHVRFDYELGESFYHDMLGTVAEEFIARGLARESDGALCVFLDGFDAPMIIRKKDGAYLYATTDLATIRYRMREFQPDAVLYVVDHRQSEHFEKLFAAARLWGYDQVELRHIGFGTIMGEDGKPYKTRSGDTVGLEGLLDTAVAMAGEVITANRKEGESLLTREEEKAVAESVGIAAIKYADLSQNRTSDYKFSYQKMVALEGNTATYMQYAYARVNGIFRRGNVSREEVSRSTAPILLAEPAERALGVQLLRFSEALAEVTVDYRPNLLTAYLYDLAKAFTTFFENCPVLKAGSPELMHSRLKLCDLTARTIAKGLELLGIAVVEKM